MIKPDTLPRPTGRAAFPRCRAGYIDAAVSGSTGNQEQQVVARRLYYLTWRGQRTGPRGEFSKLWTQRIGGAKVRPAILTGQRQRVVLRRCGSPYGWCARLVGANRRSRHVSINGGHFFGPYSACCDALSVLGVGWLMWRDVDSYEHGGKLFSNAESGTPNVICDHRTGVG
jgi:hypothetical protein